MKTLPLLFAAALGLMAVVPGAKAADGDVTTVLARANVIVNDAQVYLSDLFDGVPPEQDLVISASPEPGRARLFTAGVLRKLAREHNLKWEGDHARARVRLERAGEPVSKDRVIDVVTLALQDGGVTGPVEVEIYNRFVNVLLPRGIGYDLYVEAMDHSARDGRLNATIRVESSDGQAFDTRIMGRVHQMVQIPVVMRPILPGEIIQAEDIGWEEKRSHRVNRSTASDPAAIIGMQARRSLSAGAPILHSDIEPNILIKRRDLVTLVVKSKTMRLTAKGIALENGPMGHVIRVRNTTSDRMVEGKIIGMGVVEVTLGAQLAQLSQ